MTDGLFVLPDNAGKKERVGGARDCGTNVR